MLEGGKTTNFTRLSVFGGVCALLGVAQSGPGGDSASEDGNCSHHSPGCGLGDEQEHLHPRVCKGVGAQSNCSARGGQWVLLPVPQPLVWDLLPDQVSENKGEMQGAVN